MSGHPLDRLGWLARQLVHAIVAVPMLPLVLAGALLGRIGSRRRLRSGARARLVWGPVPIISIKYWSEALRARGYASQTCVFGHYAINERSDFDLHYDDLLAGGVLLHPLRAYAVFLWALRSADVYLCFFDGGFLRNTALRRLELPLWRLAGKRVVVSPYGSDIAVPGHLGVAEPWLLEDYPQIVSNAGWVRRKVLHYARWATLIVRNYQYGFLPRWDVLWPTQIAIDSELWSPPPVSAGRHVDQEVVVVHAPNHRHIKGTDLLVEALQGLREEGFRIRLDLLEQRPNSEVRTAILASDIVADQFIAGYAMFAIEGMAAGKPVLSALKWLPAEVRDDLDRRGLPIVDADRENLPAVMRELLADPDLRARLGRSGREFVMANHDYASVGAVWDAIIEHVWRGTPLPEGLATAPDC